VDIPPVAKLLADSDGDLYLLSEGPVNSRVFGSNEVFSKIRLKPLDQRAETNGIGHIQSRVIIDSPVSLLAYSFPDLPALAHRLLHHLPGIEGDVTRFGNRCAEGTESSLHTSMGCFS